MKIMYRVYGGKKCESYESAGRRYGVCADAIFDGLMSKNLRLEKDSETGIWIVTGHLPEGIKRKWRRQALEEEKGKVGINARERILDFNRSAFDLIFRKLVLGRVYGWKAGIGWAMVWVIVCWGGWYLTGSGWWFGVLTCAGLVKFIADVHEESADMKERMRERYGKYADEPYYGDAEAYGYGGTGSVYDGVGGFGCSPHGFFGWEVPCAAAKADLELMGFKFDKD